MSAETTLEDDIADHAALSAQLWRLCVRVADRLKAKGLAGRSVTLKLRRADFRLLTRAARLADATQLADVIFAAAAPLLAREATGARFRLIGVGLSSLEPAATADATLPLDDAASRRARAERATDEIRARFGADAIGKGRGWRAHSGSSE